MADADPRPGPTWLRLAAFGKRSTPAHRVGRPAGLTAWVSSGECWPRSGSPSRIVRASTAWSTLMLSLSSSRSCGSHGPVRACQYRSSVGATRLHPGLSPSRQIAARCFFLNRWAWSSRLDASYAELVRWTGRWADVRAILGGETILDVPGSRTLQNVAVAEAMTARVVTLRPGLRWPTGVTTELMTGIRTSPDGAASPGSRPCSGRRSSSGGGVVLRRPIANRSRVSPMRREVPDAQPGPGNASSARRASWAARNA